MNSQSIWPASCTSSCFMLMIWSSRERNRSPDPVVSCFFGRIALSDAATESCFSIRGNRENEIASFQGLRHRNLAISSQQSRQKTTLAQWVRNSSRATKHLAVGVMQVLRVEIGFGPFVVGEQMPFPSGRRLRHDCRLLAVLGIGLRRLGRPGLLRRVLVQEIKVVDEPDRLDGKGGCDIAIVDGEEVVAVRLFAARGKI